MSMASKAKRQRSHFRRRMMERNGLVVHKDLEARIVKEIQGHNAEHVEKQSNRVSVFKVSVSEGVFVVVYDKIRETAVTVLNEEWIELRPAPLAAGLTNERISDEH